MTNELRKNAEGYSDPTAATTLTRKEGGDIWEYKGGECLILKGRSGFATILRLHDSNLYGDRVKVADRDDGPRYVDPAFIISGRYQEMGRYVETVDTVTFEQVIEAVETVDTVTFEQVIEAVENALAIELPRKEKSDTQEVKKLREEVAQLQEDLAAARSLANFNNGRAEAAGRAEMKAKNQLELLRDMYNELLAKVVGDGGHG